MKDGAVFFLLAVVRFGKHFSVPHQNRTDGYFVFRRRLFGFAYGKFHKIDFVHSLPFKAFSRGRTLLC